jgi:hypothetical protein
LPAIFQPIRRSIGRLKKSALAFSYAILKHEKQFDEYVGGLWKPLTPEESEPLDKLISDENNTTT